jgi:hypothetical protein
METDVPVAAAALPLLERMHAHAFAPPLYLPVFAEFVRGQVIPPDCEML